MNISWPALWLHILFAALSQLDITVFCSPSFVIVTTKLNLYLTRWSTHFFLCLHLSFSSAAYPSHTSIMFSSDTGFFSSSREWNSRQRHWFRRRERRTPSSDNSSGVWTKRKRVSRKRRGERGRKREWKHGTGRIWTLPWRGEFEELFKEPEKGACVGKDCKGRKRRKGRAQ